LYRNRSRRGKNVDAWKKVSDSRFRSDIVVVAAADVLLIGGKA